MLIDEIISKARQATGLSDLGDPFVLEGLEKLRCLLRGSHYSKGSSPCNLVSLWLGYACPVHSHCYAACLDCRDRIHPRHRARP
jgi:hypothetical protein